MELFTKIVFWSWRIKNSFLKFLETVSRGFFFCLLLSSPSETEHKLNMHKTFKRHPVLTLFRMGIIRAAHGSGRGGGVPPPCLPKICHTYPTMMKYGTIIPYLKMIQKIYEPRDTPPEFCWHSADVNWKSASFVISRNTDIDCISNSFNFSSVFKYFFNKPSYSCDDVSKNGYSRPS